MASSCQKCLSFITRSLCRDKGKASNSCVKIPKQFIAHFLGTFLLQVRLYRAWYCTQWSGGVRISPFKLSLNSWIGAPGGKLTLNDWKKAVVTKNNIFRANVSPAQSRLPALKGNETSFFSDKLPWASKNRSGLNLWGSSQTHSSWFAELRAATMTVFWKR